MPAPGTRPRTRIRIRRRFPRIARSRSAESQSPRPCRSPAPAGASVYTGGGKGEISMHQPLTIAALLTLMALPVAAQAPRPAGGPPMDPVPTLTVSGSGKARVAPDEAHVRLGVVAQAPTARAVQDQVNRTANAVLEAVRKLGIPAEDIQTS